MVSFGMKTGIVGLLGKTVSLMENMGFLWLVYSGFELDRRAADSPCSKTQDLRKQKSTRCSLRYHITFLRPNLSKNSQKRSKSEIL